MTDCKKPIRRHMLILGIIFVGIMCLLISLQAAGMLRLAMNRRHDAHLRDVIAHVETNLDLSDLEECIKTGVPSEKYYALQRQFNDMVDDFELIYLYICIPVDDGEGTMIYPVCSLSEAERIMGYTQDWPLMYEDRVDFTAEQLKPYLAAWEKKTEVSVFEGDSAFGPRYTMCKPLVNPEGETVALLGADLSTRDVRQQLGSYILYSVLLILFIATVFSIFVALWLRRSVTEPVIALEKRARSFAQRSHGEKDPAKLEFDPPDLQANNEVQWLSDAIEDMSESMREYLEGALSAEKRAETAEKEAEGIAKIAYVDPLTGQMSKVAYDSKRVELTQEIADENAEFAMVVIDLNNLKRVNDTYGVECGSRYIISASRVISEVYKDLPVYRVGGDEFVVILEGDAYRNRFELFDVLEEQFHIAETDMSRELWERCSAAAGMTEFSSEADRDVGQVYRRAEKIMLRNKRMMKNEMN